jgi:hypothetical protein
MKKYKVVKKLNGKFKLKEKTWYGYKSALRECEFNDYHECSIFLNFLYKDTKNYQLKNED